MTGTEGDAWAFGLAPATSGLSDQWSQYCMVEAHPSPRLHRSTPSAPAVVACLIADADLRGQQHVALHTASEVSIACTLVGTNCRRDTCREREERRH